MKVANSDEAVECLSSARCHQLDVLPKCSIPKERFSSRARPCGTSRDDPRGREQGDPQELER